jgi:hypothetical protein
MIVESFAIRVNDKLDVRVVTFSGSIGRYVIYVWRVESGATRRALMERESLKRNCSRIETVTFLINSLGCSLRLSSFQQKVSIYNYTLSQFESCCFSFEFYTCNNRLLLILQIKNDRNQHISFQLKKRLFHEMLF